MSLLTHAAVLNAMTTSPWDFSNRLLYDLCAEHPAHSNTGEVLAKILLIGRVFAAAIERRKTMTDVQNDDHYISTVAPAIQAFQFRLHAILTRLRPNTLNAGCCRQLMPNPSIDRTC